MTYQIYCTLQDVLDDLTINGVRDDAHVMKFIRAASKFFEQRGGQFIPITEQRKYNGDSGYDLWVDPLLAITAFSVLDGSTTYTLTSVDYQLNPAARWWPNGPYTRLEIDLDGQIGTWIKGQQNVQITGRWGLYEETRALSATVTTDGTSYLLLSASGGISPGAVLLVGSEQMYVDSFGTPTDSTANLNEALDNSEEEIDVTSGAAFNAGEIIRVDFEQMRVLDIVSNTLLVVRGYNNTKRVTHTTTTDVYVYRTFNVTRAVNGTTQAVHATGAAVNRYVAPDDVNYLCRQIAGLMLKKSQSGWAGKVGNADTGETFYFNEFPNDPIGKIMRGYLGKIIR